MPFPSWPRRRHLALLAIAPLLGALLVVSSGASLAAVSPVWLVLTGLAALTGSAVLASYLPAHGWRPEVGCSPCAVVAGMSVLGSLMAAHSYGAEVTGPALGVAVTLFGLSQRLGDSTRCEVRPAPGPQTADATPRPLQAAADPGDASAA